MEQTSERPVERQRRCPRPPARPRFHTLADESMRRGDQALSQLDLPAAARHFASAGVTYRFLGAVVPAAIAVLELGAAYLAMGFSDRLAAVAASLKQLRPQGTVRGILFVRVCAQILEQAIEKPISFVELLERLRHQRRAAALEPETGFPHDQAIPLKENPEMSKAPLFTLPADELRRHLAGHPGWEIIEDGARLERVVPLADLQTTATGRELRPLQRSAAELAQRIVRMGVAVSCEFNGKQVEIRVPATRLGLGFVEECDHASVTGPPPEGAAA